MNWWKKLTHKKKDFYYTVYSPVVGEQYFTTMRANGSKKSGYPLEITALKGLKQNFANGANNIDNMKSVLKNLNSVYNLGMSRKLPTYRKINKDVRTLDITKIEKHYGSVVVGISDDIHSDMFNEYLKSVSNGEIKSITGVFDKLGAIFVNDAKEGLVNKNQDFINYLKNNYGEDHYLYKKAIKGDYIAPALYFSHTKTIFGYTYDYPRFYNLAYIYDLEYEYLGNNIFRTKVSVTTIHEPLAFTRNNPEYNPTQPTFYFIKDYEFPEYYTNLFDLLDNEREFRIVKLSDGRIVMIFTDDDRFFTTFTKKIEFSPTIPLKGINYSDPKAIKYANLIREKLGLQENRFKKKNRENKLFENLQGNEKMIHAELGFYLDLFPFKNRAFRNNRDAQLYLKGIMQYFAKISGIPSKGGVGLISIPIPSTSHFVTTDTGSGDGMGLEGMTLNINMEKRFRKTSPKEKCFFSTRSGSILLHLVTSDGNNGYIEYILNYSYFYRGISKNNFSRSVAFGLSANDALLAYVNKNLFDEFMDIFINEIKPRIKAIRPYTDIYGSRYALSFPSFPGSAGPYTLHIINGFHGYFPLFSYYGFNLNISSRKVPLKTSPQKLQRIGNDRVVWEIYNEWRESFPNRSNPDSNKPIIKKFAEIYTLEIAPNEENENLINPYDVLDDYINSGAVYGKNFWENTRNYSESEICWENKKEITDSYFSTQDHHPRLPMPIGLWNSIPYRGKLLAYNYSVLLRTYIKETITVRRKWTKVVGPIVAAITAVVAVVTGQYYLIALVGLVLTAVGVVFKADWLVTVGTGMVAGAAGAYVGMGAINGNLGSILGEMIASPMFYLGIVSSVATNLYGMSLENKIKGMQEKLDSKQKEWEKEKSDRMNYTGGINKTSSGGDEDFDAYYNIVDQEMLFNLIELSIDTQKNSQVFDDTKYDNTRVV